MKPEIVVLKALYAPTMAALERDYTVHQSWNTPDPIRYLQQTCANVRAAVSTTTTVVSREHIEALPKLELVACYGPYTTLIDLAAAKARNVAVTCTPDSTAEPVADLAMGMIVALLRRLCEADRFMRTGKWTSEVFPSGVEVRGKTLGIIGFGRIGRAIARRAAGFDMQICYFGPTRKADVGYPYFDNLENMARAADVLVVTCALTPQTRNLVDAHVLTALGPDGFLVNIARGPVVVEPALIAALAGKHIAGAALDVFHDEPHVPAALMKMDNVILAPHMGTSTLEVREGRSQKLLADLNAHFAGKPLRHALPL